jgi:AraC-like DNA-binding protein
MPELRQAVDSYLDRCFACEETPRVSELARELDVTRERLSREFVTLYGTALSEYLKKRQLEHACDLLEGSELSTTRIAYSSGFGTRRTFYRAFRRVTGMTPDQFRRNASRIS